jgi:hypothetical protein
MRAESAKPVPVTGSITRLRAREIVSSETVKRLFTVDPY